MRLAGKVVVVTGAGSGLGQALALELLRRGARVAAVDLRSEGLQETMAKAGSLGEGLSLHPLDITDKDILSDLITTDKVTTVIYYFSREQLVCIFIFIRPVCEPGIL